MSAKTKKLGTYLYRDTYLRIVEISEREGIFFWQVMDRLCNEALDARARRSKQGKKTQH